MLYFDDCALHSVLGFIAYIKQKPTGHKETEPLYVFFTIVNTGSQLLLSFKAIAAIETNTNRHFNAIRMVDTFAAF